jgi:hypothetical protein
MRSILEKVIDDSPYTHPMLVSALGQGYNLQRAKTPSIALTAEGEQVGERIVKDHKSARLDVLVISYNSTE